MKQFLESLYAMFIYKKKIYLIVFLVLLPFLAQANGDLSESPIDTTNNPFDAMVITEQDYVWEKSDKAPVTPETYTTWVTPLVACQAAYVVQDRMMLDYYGLSQIFMTGPEQLKMVEAYRGYLRTYFNGIVLLIEQLRNLAISSDEELSEKQVMELTAKMREEELTLYEGLRVKMWEGHALNTSEKFLAGMTMVIQKCMVDQVWWKSQLDSFSPSS
jgi:hypothetical protein